MSATRARGAEVVPNPTGDLPPVPGEAGLLDLLGVRFTGPPDADPFIRVGAIASGGTIELIGSRFLCARLGIGRPIATMDHLRPTCVVIEESFLRESRWTACIDSDGSPGRPLTAIVDAARRRSLPLYVIADRGSKTPLRLPYGQFLPNLRTEALLAAVEYPHPLLELLQSLTVEVTRGGGQ